MLIFVLSCTVAVVVSFLCSMAEAVLLSLNPVRLETLKQQGKGYAADWLDLKRNVDRPIAAILILNTIAHTGGATIAGSAFDSIWGDQYIWIFSIIFTFVVLFGTEIAPKVMGVSYNGVLAPILIKPLRLTIVVLKPLIFFTDMFSKLFRKPGAGQEGGDLEAADLVTLAQLAKSRSLIDPSQEQIIINATKLQLTTAADVMVPAEEMVFFEIGKSTVENLDVARQSLHTRFPVSETDRVNDIVGYVNFKEIFAIDPDEREDTLHHYIRHNSIVATTTRLSDVMRQLIAAKRHLAIVKNSDGEVAGMLTLEDVLEAIVGDIEEELDSGPTDFVAAGRGRWKVGGGVTIGGLEHGAGVATGESATAVLADVIEEKFGRIDKPGLQFRLGNARCTIVQARRSRAHLVTVERS